MSVTQFTIGCISLSWRHVLSNDAIVTAWQRSDNELKTAMQEEYVCCGVDNSTQDILSSREGYPVCNSTKVRRPVKQGRIPFDKPKPIRIKPCEPVLRRVTA